MKLTVSIIIITFSLASCKKDKVIIPAEPCNNIYESYSYDTVFPSPYLVTYPGSWWEYSDGSIDSCYSWEAVPIHSKTTINNCTTIVKDIKVLPYSSSVITKGQSLMGAYTYTGFALDDSKVEPAQNDDISLIFPLLSNSQGLLIFKAKAGEYPSNAINRTISINSIEHLDSLEVGGVMYYDILHSQEIEQEIFYPWNNGPYGRYDVYYARDIGIIKKDYSYDGGSGYGPYTTLELVNFHIEPY